jgi:multiple sugar transport system permease protein
MAEISNQPAPPNISPAISTSGPKLSPRAKVKPAHDRSVNLAFWTFVGPALLGLTVFTLIPIIWGFALSMSHAQNTIKPGTFVGAANYLDLLSDESFLRSLSTILVFAFFLVPLTYAVSLGLALLVHRAGWGTPFFRTVFFIPSAVSYVVASLVWKMSLFNGVESGLANQVVGAFGHEPIAWIGTVNPPWFWLVLVSARLWLQVGFFMIIFIAGLQEIPSSIYEAAAVDGAKGGWPVLRFITLPQLRATSISVLLLNFIAAFQAFDEFYNILGATGANASLARPPLVYLYSLALGDQDFGRGTAGAFILTAIIFAVTIVQGRILGFGDND